jgi:hypothetical protein
MYTSDVEIERLVETLVVVVGIFVVSVERDSSVVVDVNVVLIYSVE